MNNNVTFITSYFKIYDEDYNINKSFEKRLDLFLKLADTGINICIFISPEYKDIFIEIEKKYKNVKLVDIYLKSQLRFSKTYFPEAELCKLPERRSYIKDTEYYMYLINTKIYFIKKAIDINPFSSKYFAWIDFSLPYVFKDVDNTIEKIKIISQRNYIDHFLVIPGCSDWNNKISDLNYIKNNVCWRFCGGFLMGDKNSLLDFYDLALNNFSEFLVQTKTLLWEVNYWSWLESFKNFNPIWCPASHDDSIINIPEYLYTIKILNFVDQSDIIFYKYPHIDSDDRFFPSSSSYVYDKSKQKHILNTRYVNYFYKDNWDCDFFNDKRQIKTINLTSVLDNDLKPILFNSVNVDETTLINNHNSFSVGFG